MRYGFKECVYGKIIKPEFLFFLIKTEVGRLCFWRFPQNTAGIKKKVQLWFTFKNFSL